MAGRLTFVGASSMAEVAVATPEMYPLVNVANHVERRATFQDLRADFEATIEGLNQAQSWYIYDELDEYWDSDDDPAPAFSLCFFMPRKNQTVIWTTHEFERTEVQLWLDSYVRDRTMRWYGWPDY